MLNYKRITSIWKLVKLMSATKGKWTKDCSNPNFGASFSGQFSKVKNLESKGRDEITEKRESASKICWTMESNTIRTTGYSMNHISFQTNFFFIILGLWFIQVQILLSMEYIMYEKTNDKMVKKLSKRYPSLHIFILTRSHNCPTYLQIIIVIQKWQA